MPSWFTKAFKSAETPPKSRPNADLPSAPEPAAAAVNPRPAPRPRPAPAHIPEPKPAAKPRKVLQAPILVDEGEQSGWTPEIRIKARVAKDHRSCVFMVDRPVLAGYSAWYPNAAAAKDAPLAEYLFAIPGVANVTLHDFTVTVTREPGVAGSWEDLSKEIGARIRNHLLVGVPVVAPEFLEHVLPEDELRDKLQRVIDLEINPGIAAHSGVITLERVIGNTAFIKMGGGCQGCAASTITLREGVHKAFRDAAPQVGAILDETDHTAGSNPFYRNLPAGMEANA
jgi:Fe-S cluster biogenesis protein NfuA